MGCSSFYYSGIGKDCDAFRDKVKAVILTDVGTTITKSNALNLVPWGAITAGLTAQTGMLIPFERGYENGTDKPEMTTSNLGFTEKTFDPLPKMSGYGTINYKDYQALMAADSKDFDVFLVLNNGTIEGCENSAGLLTGKRASLNVEFGLPKADNLQQSYPIHLNFLDIEQFKTKSYLFKPNFTYNELKDVNPNGVEVVVVTNYATGTVIVKATKRGTQTPYAGATLAASWKVLSSSVDLDVAVTTVGAVSAALGVYTLTVKKDATTTPANLTDDVVLQLKVDNGTNVTYVSQPLTIVV
jgi:hypothetical protein